MDKTEMDKTEDDDGSLSFLKIPEQDGNKSRICKNVSFCLERMVQTCKC